MIAALLQDLRYAARAFWRAPAFTTLAVLTIAIGVGANAAIFSVVNAVLLRPLPYPRADSLVLLTSSEQRRSSGSAEPANFLDWRARNRSFTGLAAFLETSAIVNAGDSPDRVPGAMVNANFFDVLEVRPMGGRAFVAADEQRGAPRVAILSESLWRERFGKRPDVVGQTILVNAEPSTIIGIMPPGIDYPGRARIWFTPHNRVPDDPNLSPFEDPSAQRTHGYLQVLGRIKPGVSREAAVADMDNVARSLERDYPDDNKDVGVSIAGLREELVADIRATTLLLFAAVGLLLLVAAANVSGLLMARATARQQEISVRVALGATRGRVVAQLLTESVVLAVMGGLAGVLLAMWLVNPLVALSPDLTVAGDVTIDRNVLLFCLGTSTLVGLLFGLAPARQLTRLNVHDDLKQSARGTVGARQQRARAVLIAAEVAVSLVLLVVAGLTVRSFVRVLRVSPGFSLDHIVTVTINPPPMRYATQAQRAELWERVLSALRQIPGVQMTAATSRLPLLPGNSQRGLSVKSLPPDAQGSANYRTASPDYFAVMGIPLLRGREFNDNDREGRPKVAVVSASAGQRFWPARDPVGEHFTILDDEFTVVGVVGDVHAASLEIAPQPTVYVPYRQDAFAFMTFVLKTPAPPAAVAGAIRAAVWQVDKDQPVGAIRSMDEQLENSLQRRRFSVTLLVAFGVTAVALAAVGLYGVLAFIVSQRRREIGVRIALGATARDVIADVLGQGLRLAGLGMIVGIGLALAAARLMSALLFGTSPSDVVTFVGAAALLAAVAVVASLVPALRASRVDPLVALRDE